MGISANNFVILELIKDGSIMYTRKLQATEATTFDYTAPATGEYTWRMRSSSIGTTTTQPLTYSLDNLSIFYTYPYTLENCDNLADGYRFGFNGKEKESDMYGESNAYDFGARIYDARIGRWLSVDPLQAKYPSLSPYNFTANNPIIFVDPDGRKIKLATEEAIKSFGKAQLELFKSSDIFVVNKDGFIEINDKNFEKALEKASNHQKDILVALKDLIESNKTILCYIFETTADQEANRNQNNTLVLPATDKLKEYTVPRLDLGDRVSAFTFFEPEKTKKADLEGLENFAFVTMDNERIKKTNLLRVDEKSESADVTSSFIHELIDHGLNWVNDKNPNTKYDDKCDEVEYQNKAIRSININNENSNLKERTGADH